MKRIFAGMERHWRLLAFALMLIALIGCNGSDEEDVNLDEVSYTLSVNRFDLRMAGMVADWKQDSTRAPLTLYQSHIKPEYDFLLHWLYFGNDSLLNDTIIANDLNGFLNNKPARLLFDSIADVFPEDYDFNAQLEKPLKRLRYYFPEKEIPPVYTYVTGYSEPGALTMDPIFLSGKYWGIGLHYFLGKNCRFYPPDLPAFVRRRCAPEYIPVALMQHLSEVLIPTLEPVQQPTFVERMMREGIRMNFLDKVLFETPDSMWLYYTEQQMYWAEYYEGLVYKDFLPMLYSRDFLEADKYLTDSPFTSSLSRESAPRLGQFMGYRIVKSFLATHPEVTLRDLVSRTDYNTIFKESGYRPPREPEENK